MPPEPRVLGHVGDELDGRFVLQHCVGGGSQGWVWQALDTRQHTQVAVKLTPREAPAPSGAIARAGRFVGPNTPHVLRRGLNPQKQAFTAFTWLPGTDLDLLLADGPLPLAAWTWVGCHIARALADLHALAVIHGDVRLRNVRVVHDGARADKAVLLDLDLASEDGEVAAGQQTLHTRSPELAAGQPASVASDLYALGCVLFWAATGRPPLDGDPGELRALHRYAPRPALPEAWPAPLRTLLTDLLAVDPAARPRSAAVVSELLAWHGLLAPPETLAGLELARLPARGGVPSPLEIGSALTVGRVPELALLDAALDALTGAGAGPRVLVLTGPPGVGRSHLLREFGRRAVEHELRLVHGTHALEAGVLAQAHAPGPLGTLDLEAGAHLAVRAARHVLQQWPATPLVWLLDDAQTLTPLLQAVVDAILVEAHTEERPLLLVAAWSDATPQPPEWWRLAQTHALGPLDDASVQTWLRDLSAADLPAADVEACAGMPGQLSRRVLQSQVQRPPRSSLRRSTEPPPPLAAHLTQPLAAHLTHLLAAAGRARGPLRTLLHALALAQRPLSVAVLAQLVGGACEQLVALAVRAGAVVVSDDGLALASRDWQAEVQRQLGDDARRVHGELAQAWLASGAPHAWAVGHLWRADAAARAWHLVRPAIERALAVPDFAQADALLADAEVYGETSGVLTLADWAWVLLQRSTVLGHALRVEEATLRCRELRLLDLQVAPDSAEAQWTRWAWLASAAAADVQKDGAAMLALVNEGLARHAHVLPLRAELLLLQVKAYRWLADRGGVRHSMEAAAAAFAEAHSELGDIRLWAERAFLAANIRDPEELARCVAALQPLVDGAPGVDLPPLLAARLRSALGVVYDALGLWPAAEAVLLEAEEMLRAMGHRWGHYATLMTRVTVYRRQARFADAEPLLLLAVKELESAGRSGLLASNLNNLADLYQVMGRPAEALPVARRAVAAAEGLTQPLIFALCTLAQTLEGLDQSEQAVAAARRSLEINGTPPFAASTHAACVRLLARVAGARGDHEAAAAWLQQLPDPPATPPALP
jgi:tetratricopeptide (TPR) repeat protein